MICWRAKLSYQFAQALPKGLMVIPLKVVFPQNFLFNLVGRYLRYCGTVPTYGARRVMPGKV